MRNFYLIVNREKPRVEEAAGLICSFFAEQGCRCIRLDRHDGLRRDAEVAAAYRYTDRRTVPEDTDCVICLGGDGTLIQAARDLAGRKIPLFGINMGHLGYLTQIGHEEDILPAMRDLMEDHYRLESRMMLKGCVISGGKVIMEDIALNDIVLNRMGIDAFRFELAVNGCDPDRFDGIQPVSGRSDRGAGGGSDGIDTALPAFTQFAQHRSAAG